MKKSESTFTFVKASENWSICQSLAASISLSFRLLMSFITTTRVTLSLTWRAKKEIIYTKHVRGFCPASRFHFFSIEENELVDTTDAYIYIIIHQSVLSFFDWQEGRERDMSVKHTINTFERKRKLLLALNQFNWSLNRLNKIKKKKKKEIFNSSSYGCYFIRRV